jgi:cardiolipin synthase
MTPTDGGSNTDQSRADAEVAGPWTLANLLTLFRIALTVPFLYLINGGRFGTALAVFFVASLTDFADGFIARRLKQQSRVGRFLDPLADKLLVTAAFVVLALPHAHFASIPAWLAIAVVSRDVIIGIGSLIVYLLTKFKEFKPSFLGKITTFAELGTIVWFLVFHTTDRFTFLLPFFYAILALCIASSGIEYIIQGILILRRHRRGA